MAVARCPPIIFRSRTQESMAGRRRCGANCSPRSSAARSVTTGLVRASSLTSVVMESITNASPVAALASMVPAVLFNLAPSIFLCVVALFWWMVSGICSATGWAISSARSFAAKVVFWARVIHFIFFFSGPPVAGQYGGEADEVIRYMEMDTDMEMPHELVQWLDALESEKRRLEELKVVKRVDFIFAKPGQRTGENKAQATLWCCWDGSGSRFKRVCALSLSLARAHASLSRARVCTRVRASRARLSLSLSRVSLSLSPASLSLSLSRVCMPLSLVCLCLCVSLSLGTHFLFGKSVPPSLSHTGGGGC
jgi:hypothetical protein